MSSLANRYFINTVRPCWEKNINDNIFQHQCTYIQQQHISVLQFDHKHHLTVYFWIADSEKAPQIAATVTSHGLHA